MSDVIETDYLVVGAGAAGMAFTDSLLAHSDASVTLVDRRHAPGGHWLDAYPFVRLHQPSTFYGVSSVPLASDGLDRSGLNAGFHALAGADELRAYFAQVMHQHFIPSGRVRYFPCSDYVADPAGGHRFTSRLTGASREVRVRRKLVDTAYLEGQVPAIEPPPFEVAEGVRCVPAGDITRLNGRTGRFVVIGAGKTALDTCVWLLTQGVSPQAIRWIKPREGWWLNRRFHQPHGLLPDLYAGVGLQLQVLAEARSIDEVFARLEPSGSSCASTPRWRRRCATPPSSARPSSSCCAGSTTWCAWAGYGASSAIASCWTTAACRPTGTRSTCIARRAA